MAITIMKELEDYQEDCRTKKIKDLFWAKIYLRLLKAKWYVITYIV
jgi:hypothetical protein